MLADSVRMVDYKWKGQHQNANELNQLRTDAEMFDPSEVSILICKGWSEWGSDIGPKGLETIRPEHESFLWEGIYLDLQYSSDRSL
jgi:hypothetical protein